MPKPFNNHTFLGQHPSPAPLFSKISKFFFYFLILMPILQFDCEPKETSPCANLVKYGTLFFYIVYTEHKNRLMLMDIPYSRFHQTCHQNTVYCHIFYFYDLNECLKVNLGINFEYSRPMFEIQSWVTRMESENQTTTPKSNQSVATCLNFT